MDKLFVDRGGLIDEYLPDRKRRRVRFPVCVGLRYGDNTPIICPNFILNIKKGRLFIETASLIPKGTVVELHFYIPPQEKLLGTLKGRIVDINTHPQGIFIKFLDPSGEELERLEDYLEERRHLVDKKV